MSSKKILPLMSLILIITGLSACSIYEPQKKYGDIRVEKPIESKAIFTQAIKETYDENINAEKLKNGAKKYFKGNITENNKKIIISDVYIDKDLKNPDIILSFVKSQVTDVQLRDYKTVLEYSSSKLIDFENEDFKLQFANDLADAFGFIFNNAGEPESTSYEVPIKGKKTVVISVVRGYPREESFIGIKIKENGLEKK